MAVHTEATCTIQTQSSGKEANRICKEKLRIVDSNRRAYGRVRWMSLTSKLVDVLHASNISLDLGAYVLKIDDEGIVTAALEVTCLAVKL